MEQEKAQEALRKKDPLIADIIASSEAAKKEREKEKKEEEGLEEGEKEKKKGLPPHFRLSHPENPSDDEDGSLRALSRSQGKSTPEIFNMPLTPLEQNAAPRYKRIALVLPWQQHFGLKAQKKQMTDTFKKCRDAFTAAISEWPFLAGAVRLSSKDPPRVRLRYTTFMPSRCKALVSVNMPEGEPGTEIAAILGEVEESLRISRGRTKTPKELFPEPTIEMKEMEEQAKKSFLSIGEKFELMNIFGEKVSEGQARIKKEEVREKQMMLEIENLQKANEAKESEIFLELQKQKRLLLEQDLHQEEKIFERPKLFEQKESQRKSAQNGLSNWEKDALERRKVR